ncbi:hypothetical protein K9M09_00970 [Patescibacteria group bacterium]|nr:hypothetical protein [Patescibacteria group bacterium]
MLSLKELQKIHALAKQSENLWPRPLSSTLKIHWQKTLNDDRHGLVSSLSMTILKSANKSNKDLITMANSLGVAELYFWTAANLEDDLSDDEKTPKNYLPLLSFCRDLAWKYIYQAPNLNIKQGMDAGILLTHQCHARNFKELSFINKTPKEALSAADKSIFLLIGPMILIGQLNWSQNDQNNFLQAGKYFLAAKQLADDVYDYREDWHTGHRSFAHYGLKKLPNTQELPTYFQKQANNILSLCLKSRKQLKKVIALKSHDCFDSQLNILETNCQLALSKL